MTLEQSPKMLIWNLANIKVELEEKLVFLMRSCCRGFGTTLPLRASKKNGRLQTTKFKSIKW